MYGGCSKRILQQRGEECAQNDGQEGERADGKEGTGENGQRDERVVQANERVGQARRREK